MSPTRRHRPPGDAAPAALDDAGLLSAIAGGDQDAFAELYDRYATPCHSLARRITVDPGLAEDAVQEAFLAVWRQAGTYTRERGKPGSWLVSLAHHKAVDAVRRQSSAQQRENRLAEETEWLSRGPDDAAPDSQAWRSHRRDRLITALAALTPVQREVLVLAYFGGFTYPEIAAAAGVPLGTVKTRAHAAIRRLRDHLADIADLADGVAGATSSG